MRVGSIKNGDEDISEVWTRVFPILAPSVLLRLTVKAVCESFLDWSAKPMPGTQIRMFVIHLYKNHATLSPAYQRTYVCEVFQDGSININSYKTVMSMRSSAHAEIKLAWAAKRVKPQDLFESMLADFIDAKLLSPDAQILIT